MATQLCPNCKEDSFTWSLNEDLPNLTAWGCYSCCYQAFEDEAKERVCTACKRKTESFMKDEEKEYWWCSSCNKVTDVIVNMLITTLIITLASARVSRVLYF
ncbi:MAG TPA: hypothetical protein VGB63_10455 [Pedobacter sp.]|jgi:hypothetical protein